MTTRVLTSALLVLLAGSAKADEAEHTFRLLGLFQEDRVDDLKKVVADMPEIALVSVDFATAQATFRFDAPKLFGGSAKKADKLAQAFDRRLRQASGNTFETLLIDNVEFKKLDELIIGIDGLHCKGCSYGIYRVVYKLDGVRRVTTNLKEGKMRAWIEPKKTKRETLVDALEKKKVMVVK